MSQKIKNIDTTLLHKELMDSIHADQLYKIRNDAKIRAIVTAKNYDEFKGIVDAAHLTPLSKSDRQGSGKQRWNKGIQ